VKEIVIVSGKGGTGKTSITGAFAALAERPVLADCDVDAADLHLILDPRIRERHEFRGGKKARVDAEQCTGCGRCEDVCRFQAIRCTAAPDGTAPPLFAVDPIACEGCGVCAWFCIPKAMHCEPVVNGEWYVSETRFGPLVHAHLGIAEENSGKLVTQVRRRARELCENDDRPVLLVDGSPGIGCPVIASITGADFVLLVTEPTISGEHDLERIADLARHFGVQAAVCINKCDINPAVAARIRARAGERGLACAGDLPYDRAVTAAQVQRRTIVEHANGALAASVRSLWERVQELCGA